MFDFDGVSWMPILIAAFDGLEAACESILPK